MWWQQRHWVQSQFENYLSVREIWSAWFGGLPTPCHIGGWGGICLSLSLQRMLDNKEWHSGTLPASSDFAGDIFLAEVSHWGKQNYTCVPGSTNLQEVTDGHTWNWAGCLREGKFVVYARRQGMTSRKGNIFPFEIQNNYSPSSGAAEDYKRVCSLNWYTWIKEILQCWALHSPWAIGFTDVIFFWARSAQKLQHSCKKQKVELVWSDFNHVFQQKEAYVFIPPYIHTSLELPLSPISVTFEPIWTKQWMYPKSSSSSVKLGLWVERGKAYYCLNCEIQWDIYKAMRDRCSLHPYW